MKKIINILIWVISVVSVLLTGYAYILENHSDKLPVWVVESHNNRIAWVVESHNNRIAADSKNAIDEILALCEKKHYEAYAYSIQLIFDYGQWLDDHKSLINQRLELKEAIATQIQEAINVLNSMIHKDQTKDSDELGTRSKTIALNFFNKYLRDLQ